MQVEAWMCNLWKIWLHFRCSMIPRFMYVIFFRSVIYDNNNLSLLGASIRSSSESENNKLDKQIKRASMLDAQEQK